VNRKVLAAGSVVALPLLGLLFANLGRDPHRVDSPLIGKPAPPFTLTPTGGGPAVTLDAFRGRAVVVNFWATWCVPCYEEHPALQQAARTMGKDVQFVGVIYEDEDAKVQAFLKQQGSAYPHFMDDGGKAAIAYGVYGVPETYFISPDGVVVDKYVGPLNPSALSALIERATTGARSALP
jgi:cytochrome c biogenesis protein CcmG, thiol:disulfide interchange protein DsbE